MTVTLIVIPAASKTVICLDTNKERKELIEKC